MGLTPNGDLHHYPMNAKPGFNSMGRQAGTQASMRCDHLMTLCDVILKSRIHTQYIRVLGERGIHKTALMLEFLVSIFLGYILLCLSQYSFSYSSFL